MKCPYCGFEESKVIDSRPSDDSERIRRRRECLKCARRFTTYETIEAPPIIVIKRDKSRQVFDKAKLLSGMLRACEKRMVPVEVLEKAVSDIELTIQNDGEKEILSTRIGEMALEKLKDIDPIAYIRFASVYKDFKDLSAFMDELKNLTDEAQ